MFQSMVARMEYYTLRFTVNVNWNSDNRKWNVNFWQFDDNQWNVENVVFSRKSLFISKNHALVHDFC